VVYRRPIVAGSGAQVLLIVALPRAGVRPVAALVYQRRKHFINLFVWPATSGSDETAKATTHQGYNLVHWTRAGMTYWGVSDLSMNQLQEFAQLVQK